MRIRGWKDFVNGHTSPYDDLGHGTHVAGIVGGNGLNSLGLHAGVAPAVNLVALKVLDYRGAGVISNVIAAIEYAIANRTAYNIRVINMSVGATVTESYHVDPLTLAAKRAVDAGSSSWRRPATAVATRRAARSTAALPRRATPPGC
jgi:serine protease AprX